MLRKITIMIFLILTVVWFTNSDSTNLEEKYDVEKIMRAARWSVARWSMIQNRRNGDLEEYLGTVISVHGFGD